MYTQLDLEMHWSAMVKVARSVLGCAADAEECAAAAIAQVLERQPRGIQNLEAFMVTVAKRRAQDRLRGKIRLRRRLTALCSTDHVPDIGTAIADQDAEQWLVLEARRILTPRSFRLLEASGGAEPLAEIATREGMTVSAVKSDVRRSRAKLLSVWARASAALGALWAGLRRLPSTAPALATVAVFTFAPLLIPAVDGLGSPDASPIIGVIEGERQLAPSVASWVEPAVSPVHRARSVLASTPRSRGSVKAPLVHESDPVGMTTVDADRHGAGPDAGPVGTLVECLNNVNPDPATFDPHHLGC